MPNPASIDDVADRWRPLTSQEQTNAAVFLDDAWRMLKRRIPDLETRIAADLTNELRDETVRVLAQAVLRVLKNPDGFTRESLDDYSYARNEAVSSGLLFFTDDELDGLTLDAGSNGKAFTIDTTPVGVGVETEYPISVTGLPDWLDWS